MVTTVRLAPCNRDGDNGMTCTITTLEPVELALNGGTLPADHSSQDLDGPGTKAVFEALSPGRSGDGIRMDFGRLIAASTGSNLAAFRPDVNRGRAGADVVPVPEPASLPRAWVRWRL